MNNERLQVTDHNNLNTPGHVLGRARWLMLLLPFSTCTQKRTVGHVLMTTMAIKLIKLASLFLHLQVREALNGKQIVPFRLRRRFYSVVLSLGERRQRYWAGAVSGERGMLFLQLTANEQNEPILNLKQKLKKLQLYPRQPQSPPCHPYQDGRRRENNKKIKFPPPVRLFFPLLISLILPAKAFSFPFYDFLNFCWLKLIQLS